MQGPDVAKLSETLKCIARTVQLCARQKKQAVKLFLKSQLEVTGRNA